MQKRGKNICNFVVNIIAADGMWRHYTEISWTFISNNTQTISNYMDLKTIWLVVRSKILLNSQQQNTDVCVYVCVCALVGGRKYVYVCVHWDNRMFT